MSVTDKDSFLVMNKSVILFVHDYSINRATKGLLVGKFVMPCVAYGLRYIACTYSYTYVGRFLVIHRQMEM